MKKLLIAAAIVCAAAISQAAQCSWKSGNITDHDGAYFSSGEVTGYLYVLTADQYSTYSAMSSETLSKAIFNDFGKTGTSASSGAVGTVTIKDTAVASAQYRAILYYDNANSTAENQYVMGNVAEYTWSGSGAAAVNNLGVYRGGSSTAAATAWATISDVPEPTSGLLLLLGMAGLALRRRRA